MLQACQHVIQVVLVLFFRADLDNGVAIPVTTCLDASSWILLLQSVNMLIQTNTDVLIEVVLLLLSRSLPIELLQFLHQDALLSDLALLVRHVHVFLLKVLKQIGQPLVTLTLLPLSRHHFLSAQLLTLLLHELNLDPVV